MEQLNRPEILAPCGSMETLIAAVRSGADAVYLGMGDFNARRGAKNFDKKELTEAVAYAHSHGVRVYITLNTLVSDSELPAALDTAETALCCGADAFIVQDLGLAKALRFSFPAIRLHASTQCSAVTPDGFRALEEMGFSRAVIPREMSLDEIREIRRSTNMELELFVHGALCMCVSGQCYLSGMLGSRSGNRGLCAQPCRLPFSANGSGSCDLSLKDLSLIRHLGEIESSGISSLKIEGRMKRPEYVAAAVTACKKALDGIYDPSDEDRLRSVFSRSGFTDAYFTGTRQDMFGTRQKEDVIAADGVLKELARLYEKEVPRLPMAMRFTCRRGAPVTLTASARGKSVTVSAAPPEEALNKPLTEEGVAARLAKLGGTPFFTDKIEVELDAGVIAPASVINSLRRDAVAALSNEDIAPPARLPYSAPKKTQGHAGKPFFTARFTDAAQIPENHPFKRIFLPLWEKPAHFVQHSAGVEIPRGMFGREQELINKLQSLKAAGVTQALCGDVGAYRTAKALGFDVYADFGLNIFNSETAALYQKGVLSFELTLAQANAVTMEESGIIAYGKVPLMLTRNCPVKNRIGCAACGKNGALTDRKGYRFPVKCSPAPCVEILNPLPLYMADRLDEIHTDFIHFYFTDESREIIDGIVIMYKNQEKCRANYTRGLSYRGVK